MISNFCKKHKCAGLVLISAIYNIRSSYCEEKETLTNNLKYVTIKQNLSISAETNSENYIGDKLHAIPFNSKVAYTLKSLFNFNRTGEDKLFKKFDFDTKVTALDGNFFVGDIIKYKKKFGLYLLDNYISFESANINYYFIEIGGKHKLGVNVVYGNDLYQNEDVKVLGFLFKYDLNLEDYKNMKKFTFDFGPELGTDGSLLIYKLLSKWNEKNPSEYKYLGPSIFCTNNYLEAGLSSIIPSIRMSAGIESDILDAGIKFYINPFINAFVNSAQNYMQWGVILDFKNKISDDKFIKEVNWGIGIGRDELLSHNFIKSYINGFDENEADVFTYDEKNNKYFSTVRPLLMNEHVSFTVLFGHLLNKIDFIKELNLNISVKSEDIFNLCIFPKSSTFISKKISNITKHHSFEISIETNIKFNENVSNHNKNLWIFNNLEITGLPLKLFFKPTYACKKENDDLKVDMKESTFGIEGSLVKANFNAGKGHHFGVGLATIEYFNKKFKWEKFIEANYTFNVTEFLNRNK